MKPAPRILALLLLAGHVPAQEPTPTLRADALEVLVDVVVRDRHGKSLRGLKATDFVVKEDGAEQAVTAFRERRAESADAAVQAAQSNGAAPVYRNSVQVSKQIRLVSLVYDRLGPAARRLSRQASLDFLEKDLGPNTYYAVFTIDRGFRNLQAYTADRTSLRRAIERATSGERSNFSSDLQGFESAAGSTRGSEGAAEALATLAAGGRGPGAVDTSALPNEEAARMVAEMANLSEQINREELGRMSVFSLWGVLKELQRLPGRKMALYFAEGLQMPTGVVEQFKSMVSDANRANVSVYAIDARGLLTSSDQAAANARLTEATRWSRYVTTTERESFAANKQEFRTFDRALDSIRGNAQQAMAELAESTGGFLIANTNDLRAPLERLSEDFRSYYELSYRPSNQTPDGRFRAIAVKVNHPGAVVQARDGYFALPTLEGQAVFPYEVPLLRALSATPLPQQLEFHARVLQFHDHSAVLVFDLPMSGITFTRDEAARKYRSHIAVLALVKDEQGRVVAKLSRDVPLNEPLDKVGGFRQGRFIATRLVRLPPGRYTVESVATDYEGQHTAARRSVLVVAPRQSQVGISEICLVRRMDRNPDERDVADPFQLSRGRVIPTLQDHVQAGPGRMLSLFLSLYPRESEAEPPKLILEMLRDGKLLSRTAPPLPPAEISGAIPFVAQTPLDAVAPGQYEFRATLVQGAAAARRSMYVNVD